MKVVCVVDSISQISMNVDLLKSRFGNNILFVVKADLVDLFKTYNLQANAIYYNNLPKVIHVMLAKSETEDVIIYYSSLKLDNNLLNRFLTTIGDKSKIVDLMPKYNIFERMSNATYNIYVKSLFKSKDATISPKLQFLPMRFVQELLATHFGNRLFETTPENTKIIYIEEKELSNNLKIKTKMSRNLLIPLIVALVITIGLLLCLKFFGVSYLLVIAFVCLYVLDLVLAIIYQCKKHFDQRFFK